MVFGHELRDHVMQFIDVELRRHKRIYVWTIEHLNRFASARARVLYPQGGIPVTVINGQTIVGFRPSQFDSALGSQ